jgi:hypothetical protein
MIEVNFISLLVVLTFVVILAVLVESFIDED